MFIVHCDLWRTKLHLKVAVSSHSARLFLISQIAGNFRFLLVPTKMCCKLLCWLSFLIYFSSKSLIQSCRVAKSHFHPLLFVYIRGVLH